MENVKKSKKSKSSKNQKNNPFLSENLKIFSTRALQSTLFKNPGGGTMSFTEDGRTDKRKSLCLILDIWADGVLQYIPLHYTEIF